MRISYHATWNGHEGTAAQLENGRFSRGCTTDRLSNYGGVKCGHSRSGEGRCMGQRASAIFGITGYSLWRPGHGTEHALLLAGCDLGPGWETIGTQRVKLVGNRTARAKKLESTVDRLRRAGIASNPGIGRSMDYQPRDGSSREI